MMFINHRTDLLKTIYSTCQMRYESLGKLRQLSWKLRNHLVGLYVTSNLDYTQVVRNTTKTTQLVSFSDGYTLRCTSRSFQPTTNDDDFNAILQY